MKSRNFPFYLSKFFLEYLPNIRGCSPQTIDSYRYTFIHFLNYFQEHKSIGAIDLSLSHFTKDEVINFLNWLETSKGNSVLTRNNRLAAIKSFCKFVSYERPDHLVSYQSIISIPTKNTIKKEIGYLKMEGIKLLVNQIDINQKNGLRDYVIVLLLYSTGVRVSELVNIRVRDFSLTAPYTLKVIGKGNKGRYIPLVRSSLPHIKKYLETINDGLFDTFVFKNNMKSQLSRQGVNFIIKKYALMANAVDPCLVPKNLSPHMLRHTAAMELLSSGVDLIYIRDILGHQSIETTEIYAKTDTNLKRKAIEEASKIVVPFEEASWIDNSELKQWLANLGKPK